MTMACPISAPPAWRARLHALLRTDSTLAGLVRSALSTISLAQKSGGLAVAFNGGKDCTALLYLVLEVWLTENLEISSKLPLVYIIPDESEEFAEVSDFVHATSASLPVDLVEINGQPLKGALFELKTLNPKISHICMGTRRSDPHGAILTAMTPTDAGWPEYVRVNPLLEWEYCDIWKFLLEIQVPVCSLYSQGYSSIGAISRTKTNPLLWKAGQWAHASQLADGSLEREGRA